MPVIRPPMSSRICRWLSAGLAVSMMVSPLPRRLIASGSSLLSPYPDCPPIRRIVARVARSTPEAVPVDPPAAHGGGPLGDRPPRAALPVLERLGQPLAVGGIVPAVGEGREGDLGIDRRDPV